MSYCRFIDADAYIYDDVNYGIICCVCSLMPIGKTNGFIIEGGAELCMNENFIAGYDYDKMLAHIAEHRAVGDYIPDDVDERLIFERDCIHEFEPCWDTVRCKHCWSSP